MHASDPCFLSFDVLDLDPERELPVIGPLGELPAIEDLTDDPGRRAERSLGVRGRHADLNPLEPRYLRRLRGGQRHWLGKQAEDASEYAG